MFVIIYLCTVMCLQYGLSENPNVSRYIHRLPKNVQPQFYNLTLWMPREWNNFTYDGQVSIEISIIEKSNSISLNVDGLMIHKNKTILLNSENNRVEILSQLYDDERQFFIIQFREYLEVGNYSMSMWFNGEIRDDVFGFYRSQYKVGDETRWIALTQFSPTFARRAFPCFDEPYLKATFKLRIGHYGNQTVTSNTHQEKSDLIDSTNYFMTTMIQTPIMSTYLLGWAIHDFNYVHLLNSTSFGMWTRQSMMGKQSIALEAGKLIYSALESWMNIQSPIRKLEHMAIPDFNFHAMENWGMITFRESVVFLETDVSPTKSIQDGLGTIAHEYAHTWFGNLVTPEFWDVAWLKEGFATYFSYFSRSLIHPDLRIMDLFVVETLHDVFRDDAEEHNRTMNGKNLDSVNNTLDLLDFCAYKKGASIVRMVQNIMGEESFKMALRSYLMTRSYNFTTPSILYSYLRNFTQVSEILGGRIDIGETIETYANKPGYPLVTITRNYSSNLIEISQERFYPNSNFTHTKSVGWWIPLNLVSISQRNSNLTKFGSIWLSPKDKKITIKLNINPTEWVIGDIDKVGYYRINYDISNWNILIEHLKSKRFDDIHRIARASIIDDAFNLARGGYIHYKIPFQLGSYLRNEIEFEPWFAAIKSFNFLQLMLQDSVAFRTSLQDYIKYILEPIYQLLTFNELEDDQYHTKLLRNLVMTTACQVKNADCLETAITIFRDWISESSQGIKPNLKGIVYCEGIKAGNHEEWEQVFMKFLEADLHIEKELLLKGLGCSTNVILIKKLLDFSISNNGPELPKQYRLTIVNNILDGGSENVHHTLDFIIHNVEKIIQLRGHKFLNKIFHAIKHKITTMKNLQTLSSLIDTNINHLGPSLKSAKDAIKYATNTLAWIKEYSPIIVKLLDFKMIVPL